MQIFNLQDNLQEKNKKIIIKPIIFNFNGENQCVKSFVCDFDYYKQNELIAIYADYFAAFVDGVISIVKMVGFKDFFQKFQKHWNNNKKAVSVSVNYNNSQIVDFDIINIEPFEISNKKEVYKEFLEIVEKEKLSIQEKVIEYKDVFGKPCNIFLKEIWEQQK